MRMFRRLFCKKPPRVAFSSSRASSNTERCRAMLPFSPLVHGRKAHGIPTLQPVTDRQSTAAARLEGSQPAGSPARSRAPRAHRRGRLPQALSRGGVPLPVSVSGRGARLPRGRGLQPHPGGSHSAGASRDSRMHKEGGAACHRGKAARSTSWWRISPRGRMRRLSFAECQSPRRPKRASGSLRRCRALAPPRRALQLARHPLPLRPSPLAPLPAGPSRWDASGSSSQRIASSSRRCERFKRSCGTRFPMATSPGSSDGASACCSKTSSTRSSGRRRVPRPVQGKPRSRHVPNSVRREVAERDGESCSYRGRNGKVCGAKDFLEYEHRDPWAKHGAHRSKRMRLLCRTHNLLAAEGEFGRAGKRRDRTGACRFPAT